MIKGISKFVSVVVIAIFLLTVFAGCGNSTSTPSQTTEKTQAATTEAAATAAQPKEVKLTIWNYPAADGAYEVAIKKGFELYNKNNPNVSFVQEVIPYDGGPEKVNVSIAANSAPDVLFDYPGRVLGYAAKGAIVPVDDVIKLIENDFNAGLLDAYKLPDGNRYGIPIFGNLMCGIVNKALFEAAGAADLLPQNPEGSWTTDEFLKAMNAIKDYKGKEKGVYPTALYAGDRYGDWQMWEVYLGFGAAPFSDDQQKCTINSPEGVKALDFLLGLTDAGLTTPGAPTLKEDNMFPLFNEGKIAFMFSGYASLIGPTLTSIDKKEITVPMEPVLVTMPYDSGKAPAVFVGADGIAIFNNEDADKIAAAKDFMKYFANDNPGTLEFVKATGQIPAKNAPDLFADAAPVLKFNLDRASAMIAKYGKISYYAVPNLNNVRDAQFPETQAAYAKAKTSQQALDDFAKTANEIIAKAAK